MAQDIQTRIRELAYLMWESAGRQQGMAMEYWLKAENEVLSTLQAAARMLPGGTTVKSTRTPSVASAPISASATAATKAVPGPVGEATPTESQSAGKRPEQKVAPRRKTKT